MTYTWFSLAAIFDEACMLLEQRGLSLSNEIEQLIAQRISQAAESGERDRNKLLATALERIVAENGLIDRPLLLN